MSKGSTIVPVRIPAWLMHDMLLAVGMANIHTRLEPYSLSSWIRKAIEEKLHHRMRSRAKGRKRNPSTTGQGGES